MRPLEILVIAWSFLTLLLMGYRIVSPRQLRMLAAVDAVFLLLHALIEGMHWQMLPAYLAAFVTGWYSLIYGKPHRALLPWLGSATASLLLLSCGLSWTLPMFRLPAPTGRYAIGTQIVALVNDHPRDVSSAGPDGKRALMIQLWYPAMKSQAPRAPYRILAETTFESSYQSVLWTHARWNAPIAPMKMPVLLLNPAWTGRRTYYMYLVEDLVSHGYLVAGIDHTGNSGPTAFPDGHVSQPIAHPDFDFEHNSFAQENAVGAKEMEIQSDDDRFVLDQLQAWNADPASIYHGHLDMTRVGALGHSFGGGVAAEDCFEDPRFKAALDLDGSYWGPVQSAGIATPLMMIEEDIAQFTPEQLKVNANAVSHQFDVTDAITMQHSNGYHVTLHGSSHSSYSDRNLFSPWKRYSGVGDIPALREYEMIRSYALAFFNKTLNGVDSSLLSPADRTYPEATVEVLHRDAAAK